MSGTSNRLAKPGNPDALWDTELQAVRWAPDLVVLPLVPVFTTEDGGSAYGMSDDGSTIVGFSKGARQGTISMTGVTRWVGTTSVEFVGPLGQGNSLSSAAEAVSADGSVIVGHSGSHQKAFRWEGGVYTEIGALPGATKSLYHPGSIGDCFT